MISSKFDFAQHLHGEFTKIERLRLAYELVEHALLFLQIEWFSDLCSCCVYRLESSDLTSAYTVRVNKPNHADHIDPETGKSGDLTL
jgi:hypothetical protein